MAHRAGPVAEVRGTAADGCDRERTDLATRTAKGDDIEPEPGEREESDEGRVEGQGAEENTADQHDEAYAIEHSYALAAESLGGTPTPPRGWHVSPPARAGEECGTLWRRE